MSLDFIGAFFMTKPKNTSARTYPLLEHAFKQLHEPLYFYALKFVDSPDVAKDIIQDVFLGILNSQGRSDIDNLKAYLFRSVRNNCLNYIKHSEVKSEFARLEKERIKREIEYYDIHQTLVEKELQQKLNEIIEELPEKYKTPFKLSRFEDLSNKEIADKLNLQVRTVETQIYRALNMIREKIENKGLTLLHLFFLKKERFF